MEHSYNNLVSLSGILPKSILSKGSLHVHVRCPAPHGGLTSATLRRSMRMELIWVE